jgi:hemin uptake protein HemP
MNKQTPQAPPPAGSGVVKRLGRRPARIPSKVVLGGDSEVVIVHGSEEYLLRVNPEGKLVLSR